MKNPSGAVNRRGFGYYFWGTILVLIAITTALVILAMLRPVPNQSATETPPPPISITQERLAQVEVRARQAGHEAVDANLDDALDLIFQPVYASIPTYAGFHYSVWGQYAELLAAAAETTGLEKEIGSLMRRHLFGDFQARYDQQMEYLQQIHQQATRGIYEAEKERLAKETGQPLPQAAQRVLADAQQRMFVTVPAAATGSALVATIVKPIAAKIVASTAAKTGLKGIGKATSIGGTAAAGAATGSFFGPIGTVVGGIGGGVIGWLAVDYTVVKLDEYFNRDAFEAELRLAIDEEKGRLRSQILTHYSRLHP